MKFLFAVAFLFALSLPLYAQSSSLSGQVTDLNGTVISGAEVTAIATDKTRFSATSDAHGVYDIKKLPGGTYRLEFKIPTCNDFVVPEYVLGSGTNARLDAEIPATNCAAVAQNSATGSNEWFEEPFLPNSVKTQVTRATEKPVRPIKDKRKKTRRH